CTAHVLSRGRPAGPVPGGVPAGGPPVPGRRGRRRAGRAQPYVAGGSAAVSINIVILAAGVGSRLGRPHPKPLTRLADGQTILGRALDLLSSRFSRHSIHLVVGFKKEMIMEEVPDVGFIYNQAYGDTNTSKSLLKALTILGPGGVLWLNGDVVFDPQVLDLLLPHIAMDHSFISVNTAKVPAEERQSHLR